MRTRASSASTPHAPRAAPGVVAVFTGADTGGALKPIPCAWLVPNADLKVADVPCIARDVVRYVGDFVAVVVAETCYQAQDALDLIDVDYEPLPAVIDPQKARRPRARRSCTRRRPGNQAFHWTVAGGDIEAAFAKADVVVKDTHRAAASDSDRDGAARRRRPVERGDAAS